LRKTGVQVVRLAGRGARLNLAAVIEELGRREILSVLLEAGATLNSAALSSGIVDKMRVFFAPRLAGYARKGLGDVSSSARLRTVQELENTSVEAFGPDFAIEGYLRDVYRTR
jgi:diaminohydroxyphosphoribosylaminopyrimidine deaminase/5-amino-6-(5-phosphoribosylamino)uracil reductase